MASSQTVSSTVQKQGMKGLWLYTAVFTVVALLCSVLLRTWTLDQHFAVLPDDYSCQHHYSVELLSFDPLLMYLDGFISPREIDHLLEVSKDRWNQSLVYQPDPNDKDEGYVSHVNKTIRSSQSAMIPRRDPVAKCLASRLRSLLGNLQHISVQPMQLVKYEGGERFRMHYDWMQEPMFESYDLDVPIQPSNRFMSVFIYLADQCTGGETYFPDVYGVSLSADGDKFSRTDSEKGLLVRPRKGSAVLWNNVFMNGTGDWRVAHAGLPVTSGIKIGMNLFSVFYLNSPIVGEHTIDFEHQKA